jgi:hypothetical protein
MTSDNQVIIPSLLSLKFHTSFFPRLLWFKLSPKPEEKPRTSFNSNLELMVVFFVSLLFLVTGTAMVLGKNFLLGSPLAILGLAGTAYILFSSWAAQRGTKPTYDNFLIWIFFFLAFLGLTVGLFFTSVNHYSHLIVLSVGVLGLLVGYFVGIFGGLYLQSLGWVSGLLNGLAGPAIIGLIIVDMLFLVAS